jgi:hypothetical protein
MEGKKVGQNTKKQVVARGVKRSVSFSNPFNVREVIFYTTPAQLVYETSFDACADSMRSLSAVLPSVAKNTGEMMAVNGAVDHLTNSAMAEIRKEVARIKKIAEDNGIQIERLSYSNSMRYPAKLTCSKASVYLQMILELDELMCLVHSAWFAGFIADDAKASLERQWRRKISGVSAEVQAIAARAFRATIKSRDSDTAKPAAVASDEKESDTTVAPKPAKPKPAKKVPAAIEPAHQSVEVAAAI